MGGCSEGGRPKSRKIGHDKLISIVKPDSNNPVEVSRMARKSEVKAPLVRQQGRSLDLNEAEFTSKDVSLALNIVSSKGDLSVKKCEIDIGESSRIKEIENKCEISENIDISSFKSNIDVYNPPVRSSKQNVQKRMQCHLQSAFKNEGLIWLGNCESSEDDIKSNDIKNINDTEGVIPNDSGVSDILNYEKHVKSDPLWTCTLEKVVNEPIDIVDDESVDIVVDENVDIKSSSINVNNEGVSLNERKNENWLIIARKNLKKIENESGRMTPVTQNKKKNSKLENLTIGSSGKKSRLKIGDRKSSSVNDIRKLWERKLNVNAKENLRTPVRDKPQINSQINCNKVKKIIAELNPKSDLIRTVSPKNSNVKSQGLIDHWVVRNKSVGSQTKHEDIGRNEKGEIELDRSRVGHRDNQ